MLVAIYSVDGDLPLLERADPPGCWQRVAGARHRVNESLFEAAIRKLVNENRIVGSSAVPHEWLVAWRMRNVYDIHPYFLQRYTAGVTRNLKHAFGLRVARAVTISSPARAHAVELAAGARSG